MLDRIHFQKIELELWIREVMGKELVTIMLNDKYFRRMINCKRYLMMFGSTSIHLAYDLLITYIHSEKDFSMRKGIINQLRNYMHLSF